MFLVARVSDHDRTNSRSQSHKESNFSMSAWEYAAPTTRLDSRVVFFGPFAGVALRQNGEAELHVN